MPSRAAALLALAGLLAGGCASAVEPYLDPTDPPPTIDPGQLLLTLTDDDIEGWYQPDVRMHRDATLASSPAYGPLRRQVILAHEIYTGMSREDVIFAFLAQPTRVRNQGPPGGRTFLWEPGNFWVRFDVYGRVAEAGRY